MEKIESDKLINCKDKQKKIYLTNKINKKFLVLCGNMENRNLYLGRAHT